MFIKTGVSKIVVKDVFHTLEDLSSFIKTARKDSDARQLLSKIASYAPIKANPQDYLYIRNRAISAEETHGPNQNWDAFPSEEIVKGYRTFINVPNTVDHVNTGKDEEVIGMVLDSSYVPKQLYRPSTGELFPFKETIALKNDQIIGDWVENLWAIDKKLAERHTPGLVEGILSGEISDSSMGALVEMSKCSICGNESSSPDDYCEHIKGNNKGQFFEVNGVKRKSYERNFGLTFFEDTLILSDAFAKKAGTRASAGGEGADANAKILEVVAAIKAQDSILQFIRRANVPSSLPQSQQNQQRGEETIKIGDSPDDFEEKKETLEEETTENIPLMNEGESADSQPGETVIYQGKEFTIDSVSIDPKTKENVYKLSNETGSIDAPESEIEFKSKEEKEMIKKQKRIEMKKKSILNYNKVKPYLKNFLNSTNLSKEQIEKAFQVYESCISSEMSILDTSKLIGKELGLGMSEVLNLGDLVRVFRDNYNQIQKKSISSTKDLIKRTSQLKRRIGLGRPRPIGELTAPHGETSRNYAGMEELKLLEGPYTCYSVACSGNKSWPGGGELRSDLSSIEEDYAEFTDHLVDKNTIVIADDDVEHIVLRGNGERLTVSEAKNLLREAWGDERIESRDGDIGYVGSKKVSRFSKTSTGKYSYDEEVFYSAYEDEDDKYSPKFGPLVDKFWKSYFKKDMTDRDENRNDREREKELFFKFLKDNKMSNRDANLFAGVASDSMNLHELAEFLKDGEGTVAKKKNSLQNRIERIRARMNQKNIDERFQSREADAETFGFESAEKILKDSPRYSSDPMPYKVNSMRRRAVNYPNKIDFSYDAEINESFCEGSEEYDALGALSPSEWQSYLDDMARTGVTVSYDSVENCYNVVGMQAGEDDQSDNVEALYDKKDIKKVSDVQLGLKETLGTIKKEFTDTIKALAIERGIDQKDFYYTSKQLRDDFNNYLGDHKTLSLAIRTGAIKRSEVAAVLPVSLQEITEELNQSGYKISQYIRKVLIGENQYQPGDTIKVDNKSSAVPEAEGTVEEVGMIQGQDGQQHPSVKIGDQWFSDEDYLISKDSSLEDLRDNRKAIAELEEENLFDELISTGEIFEKEVAPKKAPTTTRESRKVSQARLLLANRNKGKDDEPSEVLHRRNNFGSSLDSGNFFMD